MMKRIIVYFSMLLTMAATACYDDLGNYTYAPPEEPVVTGIAGRKFIAYIGDSLIISPEIKHSLKGTDQLVYHWLIAVSTELRYDNFDGPVLRMKFGYRPAFYTARFTIEDKTNGMKYFYDFTIEGRTEFTKGTMVLSDVGGVASLSFIKPGDIVKTNLYEAVNNEALPKGPLQLEYLTYPQPGLDSYWILTSELNKPGVVINPDYLLRTAYIEDKFFSPPAVIQAEQFTAGYFAPGVGNGLTTGIYNSKLYIGSGNTAPYNPTYGSYGNAIAGDYELAPSFIYQFAQYTVGYDKNRKQFVMFDNAPAYIGTKYTTIPVGAGFNPMDMGLDLITMKSLNSQASYAFLKDESGTVYEAKFYNVPNLFFTYYSREFAGSAQVKEKTKWVGSYLEIIYFSSDDKIYRYNPLNEEVALLDTDFAGLEVSMLELTEDANTLIVGVEGSLNYLDVSTGKNGGLIKTIPVTGAPVDIVIRK